MAREQIAVRFEPEMLEALDARAKREGISRQALLDFAVEPLVASESGEVRVLELPPRVNEMLDLIARGQKVGRIDVMRRALIDYAGRAAERWQINARQDDKPKLMLIAGEIEAEHGIRPYEGN